MFQEKRFSVWFQFLNRYILGTYPIDEREDEGYQSQTRYGPYCEDNPSQVIFRSLPGLGIPGGQEIANPVTQIFFTWTTQMALHASSSSTKTSTDTRGNIIRVRTG